MADFKSKYDPTKDTTHWEEEKSLPEYAEGKGERFYKIGEYSYDGGRHKYGFYGINKKEDKTFPIRRMDKNEMELFVGTVRNHQD